MTLIIGHLNRPIKRAEKATAHDSIINAGQISSNAKKKKNHQHFKKQPDKKKNRKVSNDGLREMEGMAGRKEQKNVGQWRVGEKRKKKKKDFLGEDLQRQEVEGAKRKWWRKG